MSNFASFEIYIYVFLLNPKNCGRKKMNTIYSIQSKIEKTKKENEKNNSYVNKLSQFYVKQIGRFYGLMKKLKISKTSRLLLFNILLSII